MPGFAAFGGCAVAGLPTQCAALWTLPDALALIDATLRGMVLALALLLAALLLRDHRSGPPALRVAWLLCLGLATQTISSMPWVERHVGCGGQSLLIAVAVGNGVLFWLFSAAVFDDAFRWRRWHAAAWALAAAVGAAQCPAVVSLDAADPLRLALRVALRVLPLLCALAALRAALLHWRGDLVETRRRLRLLLVGAGILYTAVQLLARLSTPSGLMTPGLALLDMGLLLAVLGGWALAVLRLPAASLLTMTGLPTSAAAPPASTAAPAVPAQPQPPLPADDALASALQQAMADDRAYRDGGLTLAALAARLAVPEYRLRRHINQRLGFRNFNAYVNGFRLADAQRWLADPAHREAPILTLALDAGFGSIGPFNRAFKAETGLTPSEFRSRALADSSAR